MFVYAQQKLVRRNFLILAVLLACAWQAQAATWTLTQAGPSTWTYTLTFDPLDNCNLFQNPTTITMSGLTGVTSAGAPTSTDFPAGALNTNNLAWTPQVLNGGTKVVWTNAVCGTGNFGVQKHVFGFSITAPTAPNAMASFVTSGISRDTGIANSLDISGSVQGPAPALPAAPAPSSLTLVLVATAVAVVTYQIKRRWYRHSREV
jgi:hypothetical protein